jgi:CBS domain-containing protein
VAGEAILQVIGTGKQEMLLISRVDASKLISSARADNWQNLNTSATPRNLRQKMSKWECYRCSNIIEADSPPEECPSCHYSLTFWLENVEREPMTVKDLVRTIFLKIDANQSAWEAARMMRDNDAGSVIVTVNGQPYGIVTERDIMYKIAAEDLPASKVLLKKIMSSPIISVPANTTVTEAVKVMGKHHIRRLLVTDNGKPLGMLSQRSLVGGSFRVVKTTGESEEKD